MKFKTIAGEGTESLEVSVVGIGCNAFGARCDEAQTAAIVEAALNAGVNFFDTSNSYSNGLSEEYIGKALGARRSDVIIATKFGMHEGASRDMVYASAETSLRHLGTDYIDLYQIHRPDPQTPIEETLTALDDLVRQGKVRAIGCSNFSGEQLTEALAVSRASGFAPMVTAQNSYSLLQRDIEDGLVPVCREHNIGILPYYPLFRGMLTGKYRRGEPAPEGTRLAGGGRGAALLKDDGVFDKIESLEAFAKEREHDILEIAIAWLASQPFIPSVIAGASKPEQVAANARAAEVVLSPDDMAALDAIAPPTTAIA
jgi:aryl-alcohol dehydrogenase-like predicted oxidoreductase